MKVVFAILIAAGLLAVSFVLSGVLNFDCVLPMVLVTALWAAVDSAKLGLRRYRTGIAYGPVALFILHALLWVVAFPWYLAVRARITDGTAALKEAALPTVAA